MNNPEKKLYRVVLTNTVTMESSILEVYDDRKIADEVAMKLKDYYWHKDGWISVEEVTEAESSAA